MADEVWERVERGLDDLERRDGFSGSVLVTRGGTALLERGVGVADRASGTPVAPGTRFGLASLSKMFTAAAVLSCVRDGLLAPGDRVADLVPVDRRPRTMAEEVTVHHLLSHTSGIGDYAEEDEDVANYVEDYASLWVDRPTYAMERPLDFLPMYAEAPPVVEPGTRFHYCNAGYVLLGQVLEEVTGQTFVDAVTERVFGPAGMSRSGYLRLDESLPDVAVGYLPREPGGPWRTNLFSVPVVGGGDGGALATAGDIDRFLRAIASGDLLGEETGELMRTRHAPVADGIWMGYGLFVRADGSFAHGGGDPGVETMARHWPDHDLTLVVLSNEEGTLDPVWATLLEAVSA